MYNDRLKCLNLWAALIDILIQQKGQMIVWCDRECLKQWTRKELSFNATVSLRSMKRFSFFQLISFMVCWILFLISLVSSCSRKLLPAKSSEKATVFCLCYTKQMDAVRNRYFHQLSEETKTEVKGRWIQGIEFLCYHSTAQGCITKCKLCPFMILTKPRK